MICLLFLQNQSVDQSVKETYKNRQWFETIIFNVFMYFLSLPEVGIVFVIWRTT